MGNQKTSTLVHYKRSYRLMIDIVIKWLALVRYMVFLFEFIAMTNRPASTFMALARLFVLMILTLRNVIDTARYLNYWSCVFITYPQLYVSTDVWHLGGI